MFFYTISRKKTQKTPRREIEKALREFEDLKNSEEVTNE